MRVFVLMHFVVVSATCWAAVSVVGPGYEREHWEFCVVVFKKNFVVAETEKLKFCFAHLYECSNGFYCFYAVVFPLPN